MVLSDSLPRHCRPIVLTSVTITVILKPFLPAWNLLSLSDCYPPTIDTANKTMALCKPHQLARLLPALAFCLTIFTACSAENSQTELLASANAAVSASEYPAAVINLKNLLKINPNNTEARLLLGQTYLKLRDPASAEKELEFARRVGAEDAEILPPLAEALFNQGKNQEVLALDGVAELPAKSQSAVRTTQAKAQMTLGDHAAASVLVESALTLEPDSAEARTARAVLAAQDDPAQSRKDLVDILESNPNLESALVSLGRLERADHHPELAEAAFSRAIAANATAENYLSRATVRIELADYAGAQQDVNSARKLLPKYYEVDFMQGILDLKSGDLLAAQTALEAAYSANPEFLPTRIFLAEVNFNLGNLSRAEALAAGYISENPEYAPASKLYAAILLESGRYEEAESAVGFAIDRLPNDPELQMILANALRGQDDREAEIDVLERIRSMQPDNAAIIARLGSAYLALGEEDSGIALMTSALELDSTLLPAAQGLVSYYVKRDEAITAIKIAEDFLQKNSDAVDAYNLAGLAYISGDQLAKANMHFDTARKLAPGNPAANQNSAALALRAKDYKLARQRYNEVLQYYPDDLLTLIKLSLLEQFEGNSKEMVRHLEQAISKHPNADAPPLLLARYYLASGEPEKVASALNNLLGQNPVNPAVLDLTARAQLVQGEYSPAISNLTKLMSIAPNYAEGYFLLSQAYAGKSDEKQVLAQLNKTLDTDPKHILARLNLAQILYRKGQYDEVTRHLQALNKIAPDNPDIQYLEAMVARANEDPEEAQRLFSKLASNVSNTKTVLSLAQQEWDMGNTEIAVSRVEQWLNDNGNDLNARLYLAKFYSKSNRQAEAIAQYKVILQSAKDNLVTLNNLAWALRDTDPAQALLYAEQAYGLAKNSRPIADTYAVVLMKNQKLDKALQASNGAIADTQIGTGDPSMFFHKAQILALLGQQDEATNLLELLLNSTGAFAERPDASALLTQLQKKKLQGEG